MESKQSNTEQLLGFNKTIEEGEKTDKFDEDYKGTFYKSDIITMAISSPLTPTGQQSCLKALNGDLKRERENTKELIIFQDFFTFNSDTKSFKGTILGSLIDEFMETIKDTSIRKLIVLNNDNAQQQRETNTNFATVSELNNKYNITALLTKPYTGGLFHHKLMIQYFKNPLSVPIIYTGSFNFSNGALKSNSETMIGIASKEIAEIYLASIIDQSGLWANINIWKFLAKASPEHFHFHLLENVAFKYFKRTAENMTHFIDKYEKILIVLPLSSRDKSACVDLLSQFEGVQPLQKLGVL